MVCKQSKHKLARVWPAVAIMAIWLAGAGGGFAADAPTAGDVAVLVGSTCI